MLKGALGDCTWSWSKALGCSFCKEAGDTPQMSLGKRRWRAVESVRAGQRMHATRDCGTYKHLIRTSHCHRHMTQL